MKFGIIKKRILILFNDQLKCLTGTKYLQIVMWMIWLTFAQKQYKTYFLILFLSKTITIDDKDPPWFNTKINYFNTKFYFNRKIKFTNIFAKHFHILFQRFFNVRHRCCIKVVQRWKSNARICFIFIFGSTLFQRWSTALKQYWSDVEMLAA